MLSGSTVSGVWNATLQLCLSAVPVAEITPTYYKHNKPVINADMPSFHR